MSRRNAIHLNPHLTSDFKHNDETKKMVSDTLKRVDQFIRKGELESAESEIIKAKEIDPRNMYALALEERISNLKIELGHLEKTEQKKDTNTSAPTSISTESTKEIVVVQTESKKVIASTAPVQVPTIPIATPVQTPIVPVITSVQAPKVTTATPAHAPTVPVATPVQTPKVPTATFIQAKIPASPIISPEIKQYDPIRSRNIELDTYRKSLMEAWFDGSLTESENRQLSELKTILEITETEHKEIEKQVRRECYRNAIVQNLSTNPKEAPNAKTFIGLRQVFQISEEEHQQIQAQIINSMQHKKKNKILVIDDDVRLLELLQTALEDNGFDVTAISTSDEAFALLRRFTPDLILCDINLETSTMGGFTFYEKAQELTNVQDVPFIFLTGLTDEALVRTGKELGVDDFLMKPISEKLLVSALRGKLKRFKQIKNAAKNSKVAFTKN